MDANCDTTYNADSKTINSPNYPRPYPNNKYCTWHVAAPIGLKIRFENFSFSMQWGPNCSWDSLRIYDGSSNRSERVANLCWKDEFSGMTSTTNNILFVFNSDHEGPIAYEGFRLKLALIGTIMDFIIKLDPLLEIDIRVVERFLNIFTFR